MHHFYNILKRKFCLSLHSPPNCFCFLQGAAAQPWLVWCQALPLDTRGTGSTLSAGTPGSLLKKWSCLGNHLPLVLHSLAALMLLIPLPCYLLENDSWCLTLLWAEHHGTSAGLWVLVWEAAGPQRSGQAPHTLPCASGDRMTAAQAAPAAPGRLLLPGTSGQAMCLSSLAETRDGARWFYLLDAW